MNNNGSKEIFFQSMAKVIAESNCHPVGLVFHENSWEYPLWVLLNQRSFSGKIEHISVENATKMYGA